MSNYCYDELSGSDNIRLLRLMPYENESTEIAELHAELFVYSLQDQGKGTHLYEALSYTWDGEEKPRSIIIEREKIEKEKIEKEKPYSMTIEKEILNITTNLYQALLRLRDRLLPRIIWVDAICINQKDKVEQGQQVQLMALIYSKAYRVLVWLGETADDIEGALEDIQHAANEESTEHSDEEMNGEAIFNLLRRPWFQRIWVLQEVAAARHVVMICGSAEIDGYAFCLGLKSLQESQKLSYTAFPELQSLPSLTHLIERAGLRPKHIANSLERYSLEIRPLAELVDMFHTREATDPLDKVYALLGMSSDNPSKAGLLPDYKISWEELFQRLFKFVLSENISVETSSHRPVIKSKGYILGQVSSVKRGNTQTVAIESSNAARYLNKNTSPEIEWSLQASAKLIQERDVICLLHGASKPTIIRLCKDHFAVIVIAATPLNQSGSSGWLQTSQSSQFLRDFRLAWDWKIPQGESQDQEEYETLITGYNQALEYSKAKFGDYLGDAIRLWNDIMILDDLREYKEADQRLLEAGNSYVTAFAKEPLPQLNSQSGRTLLSFVAGEGHEDVVKLLLETANPDLKDGKDCRTPLSWAAENGHDAVVKLLLESGKVEADSKDDKDRRTPLSWAAENGHDAVVKLLLESGKVEADSKDDYGWTPLSWAAENGHEAVVKLLLESGKVEADSKDDNGWTPLSRAAENGHDAVVKLLLESGKVEADSKDERYGRTPLSWAAENGHDAVVKLLLESGKVEADSEDKDYGRTPLSWAARNGHDAVVKLLLESGKVEADSKDKHYGRTPLSWAARNGHDAVVKLLLESGKVEADSKDEHYGRTPLSWAARNGHDAVVKLLLESGKVEADSKDEHYGRTPLSWAAENGHDAVVKLLLEQLDSPTRSKSG